MKNVGIILLFLSLILSCVQNTQSTRSHFFRMDADTINGVYMEAEYYNQVNLAKDTGVLCIYGNQKLIDSLLFEPRKHDNHNFSLYSSFSKDDSNSLMVVYENSVLGIDSAAVHNTDSSIIQCRLILMFKQNQGRFELVEAYPAGPDHTKVIPPIPMSKLIVTQSFVRKYAKPLIF